jgi:hypothetical protein
VSAAAGAARIAPRRRVAAEAWSGPSPLLSALLASLAATLPLASCASPRPAAIAGAASARSEGFALAWSLFADNAAVDRSLALKTVSPATGTLVREIAAESRRIAAALEAIARRESLPLDAAGLPATEVAVRQRLRERAAWELLAARGERFERRLLLSQVEALAYGSALLEQLAADSPDAADAASLRDEAAAAAALRERAIARLAPAG